METGSRAARQAPAQSGLLEREDQLALVFESLSAAIRGQGRLLIIEGHAGTGKSSILEIAAKHAQAEGVQVLRARGSDLERDFAFGIALQLFEPVVATGSNERDELLSGAAGLARPLLDHAGAGREGVHHGLLHGLYWLTSNLCRLGSAQGSPVPMLLLVDDAHWADDASLRFLLYLSDRIEELPLVVMVAHRSTEPGTPGLIERLLSHPRADVMSLPCLSEVGVAQFIRLQLSEDADDAFCSSLHGVTGGNPFLVHALLAELRINGMKPTREAAGRLAQVTPASVLRAVTARLAGLPDACRALATSIAVLGDGTSLPHASTLAGLDSTLGAAAAQALITAEILAPEESLEFVHPLIRSAVAAELSPFRRGQAHLRAASILRDGGAPVEMIAAHLVAGGASGTDWAVDVLRQAARQARARAAPDVAADLLGRALVEQVDRETKLELLCELGRAEAAAGRSTAVERLLAALAEATDPDRRARIYLDLGNSLYLVGRYHEAAETFRRALSELLDDKGPVVRQLKALQLVATVFPERRLADSSLNLDMPPSGEPLLPADRLVLALQAVRGALAGQPADVVRPLAWRALEGPTANSAANGMWDATVGALAMALVLLEEYGPCQQLLDDALDSARARGSRRVFVMLSYLRSWPLYFQGRIVEAIADVESALASLDYGWKAHAGNACAILAHGHMERGDLQAAQRALERAAEADLEQGFHERAVLLIARGRLRLLRLDAQGALDEFRAAGELCGRSGRRTAFSWRLAAALAALAVGDPEQARQLADDEIVIARRVGSVGALGAAMRVQGLVAGRNNGLELLHEAVTMLQRSPAVLERARAMVDYGAALRRMDQRSAAREPLRAALDLASRLGASALATEAEHELRASGAQPRRSAISGLGALTPTEHRVAKLAALGLTNRQIAQSLFVGLKTVEAHLAHIYGKLCIASRAELQAALKNQGATLTST